MSHDKHDAYQLRLCGEFEQLAKTLSHANGQGQLDDIAKYDDAIRVLSKVYGEIFPGKSLFASIVLPSSANSPGISDADKQDIARRTATVMEPGIEGIKVHVTAETDREIAAKVPRRKRKYGHKGNGLKGPKTKMMVKQRNLFFKYLEKHPETEEHSRISRAHQLWQDNPKWEKAASATGEARGYSSHKALAAAK